MEVNDAPSPTNKRVGLLIIVLAILGVSRAFYLTALGRQSLDAYIFIPFQLVSGLVIGLGIAIASRRFALAFCIGLLLQIAIYFLHIFLMVYAMNR